MRLFFMRRKRLVGKTIWLDWLSIRECELVNCKLVYFGFGDLTLVGNRLKGCTFVFSGPAARALDLDRHLRAAGVSDDR